MSRRRPAVRLAAVLLVCAPAMLLPDTASAQALRPPVLVFLIDHVSPEDLLEDETIRGIAAHGGVGLLPGSDRLLDLIGEPEQVARRREGTGTFRPRRFGTVTLLGRRIGVIDSVPVIDFGSVDRGTTFASKDALRRVGEEIQERVRRLEQAEVLVIVASPTPSEAMIEAGAEVTPLVMGVGAPDTLFSEAAAATPRGDLRALTSDTTRRDGLVATVDVAPTVLGFVRIPPPEAGSPLRVARSPAPFALYEQHLANRASWVPLGVLGAVYVALVGLLALGTLALGRSAPRVMSLIATWGALSIGPIAAAMIFAGRLASPTFGGVLRLVALVTVVVVSMASLSHRLGILTPPAVIGGLVFVALAVETITGWEAALAPSLGGSALHGARFYGMPNVAIGLLLGACLYAGARLQPVPGTVLLGLGGLLAGLPMLGSNLGGAVTLFAGMGLWYAIERSERHRLSVKESILAAVLAVAGIGVVVASHVAASQPSHVAAAAGDGPGSLIVRYLERLQVGALLVLRNPAAVLVLVGLVACLLVLRRTPRSLRVTLDRHPVWERAILVLLVASVVAYLANDTGPAAVGLGFGLALAGLLYVPLAERAWNMEVA